MAATPSPLELAEADESAFVILIEPVLSAAYRLAVAMLHSNSEAEDVVQEALFRAWRNFDKFRPDLGMKAWLLTIVANESRRQRRNRWWRLRPLANERQFTAEGDKVYDPATADLRRALARLPHHQRLVIVLRYYLDLSFQDIAQILGITSQAAKLRTYRALERLRLSPEVLKDE
jgi:RNA polymerase sigma-70 factor (ECF subfamily)